MAVDRRRPLDRRTRKTEQVEGRTMWPNHRLTKKAPYKGGVRGPLRESEPVETPPHRAEFGLPPYRVALSPHAARGAPRAHRFGVVVVVQALLKYCLG